MTGLLYRENGQSVHSGAEVKNIDIDIDILGNCIFKVCKSVPHHTIPINQLTRCNNFLSLLLDVYVRLNMFRTSSRPSSGAQQLKEQPLVLPLERGGSSAVVLGRAGPTTTNSTAATTLQR